ncbi:hypothetical protein HPB52_022943 [Rhipicephalus sanguineus]|uniref:Uncharacterized protein n=1 Tax=Rhipicephalus sanguineus TaxID=34632 RepID=A0A9D4PP13_RHISA|nr:hypothetical protein HPB52_022943 [Rhipicephalus sanguineus]
MDVLKVFGAAGLEARGHDVGGLGPPKSGGHRCSDGSRERQIRRESSHDQMDGPGRQDGLRPGGAGRGSELGGSTVAPLDLTWCTRDRRCQASCTTRTPQESQYWDEGSGGIAAHPEASSWSARFKLRYDKLSGGRTFVYDQQANKVVERKS